MAVAGRQVTIIGAGIAGLAVARALALRGAAVTVYEQADRIAEVGAGLQISPNGAVVLRALGLGAALEAAGMRAKAVVLRDALSPIGACVLRMDIARLRPDQGYYFLHRADLIDLLAKGARDAGVEIRLLHHVQSVTLSPRPSFRTVTGESHMADLLIGADGLHSPTRAALTGFVAPFFTRQTAWRAVVPCTPDAPEWAQVFMAPQRHLVSYPMRGGTLRNIVAVQERNTWVEEKWSQRGDPDALRQAFHDFPAEVRGWLDHVTDVGLWGLFRHPVAKRWYHAESSGAVAILGDAAHPTLPFLAQGATMGLEDAWVMADCLDRHDDVATALAAYQSRRIARVTRVVEAANGNARAYHLSGPLRRAAHLGLRLGAKVMPDAPLRRFDWLYGHDVTQG